MRRSQQRPTSSISSPIADPCWRKSWELALPLGFVDVKVCAVSDVWSGLKLVIRKELR